MIDWKNKPDGAQRYNERCTHKWLKCEGDTVRYYSDGHWWLYLDEETGISDWVDAVTESSETPPLQLTWLDAPINATHILQHRETSEQVFARLNYKIKFMNMDNSLDYTMDQWFVVSERPDNTVTVDSTINERGERYGKFNDGANIMQTLKNVMRETDGWERLTASQREALEMIQHKIGRVLNGDPNYDDNWRDICGYSQLILDELNGTKR